MDTYNGINACCKFDFDKPLEWHLVFDGWSDYTASEFVNVLADERYHATTRQWGPVPKGERHMGHLLPCGEPNKPRFSFPVGTPLREVKAALEAHAVQQGRR